jgi:hypothetical protein
VPERGRGRFEAQMDTEAVANDPHPAMELMAKVTGGRYLYNTNDLTAGFRQTALDMQGSYTLGFYLPDDPDNKWHKLKVRVKRPGANVRYREGYLAESTPSQPQEWTAEMWRSAFANPLGSTAIPVTAKCERTASGELALTLLADANALQFQPDGENVKADLDIAIAERAADGAAKMTRFAITTKIAAGKWNEARQQGVRYERQWKPASSTTALRVIVHDIHSGQYGTLEVALDKLPH